MNMAVQPILPTTAIPLDSNKKRKHGEIVDLTGDEEGPTAIRQPVDQNNYAPPSVHSNNDRDLVDDDNDEDDEEDDKSLLEEIMDSFELDPYGPEEGDGLSAVDISNMRTKLREVGVQKFFEDTIINGDMDPRTVGLAFGLNPHTAIDEESYLRLLGLAVMRFFYRRQKLPQYNTIDDAARLLQQSHKIIVITGAGISTSLGIPDFRSKGTGFYDKLRAQGFNEAEEVFDIHNFDENPTDFFTLAGDILPDMTRCTPTHSFIRLLQDKDSLLTNYTQNIDNLETIAGVQEDKFIQCHGSFATATCRKCKHQVPGTDIFEDIRQKRVAYCKQCTRALAQNSNAPKPQERSSKHQSFSSDDEEDDDDIPQPGVMKPDITFFGEQLPNTFFDRLTEVDAQQTDLVIVIGTSLKVAPVSEVPNYLPHAVPHIYISREPIKHIDFDIQLLGNCDDVVVELCRRAGWELKHDMVPADFKVEVCPSAGSEHTWLVQPVSAEPKPLGPVIDLEVEPSVTQATNGSDEIVRIANGITPVVALDYSDEEV